MARNSPGQARAIRQLRPGERIAVVPGIPRRGQAEISRLERDRLRPGAVADALRGWESFARMPRCQRLAAFGCGEPACCPDPLDHRRILDLAVHALPPVAARVLRCRVRALDDLIRDWDELPDL